MALIPRPPNFGAPPGGRTGVPNFSRRPSSLVQESTVKKRPPIRGPALAVQFREITEGREQSSLESAMPAINAIGRVLAAPSDAVFGFFSAYSNYEGIQNPSEAIWEPWEYLKAIGAGFREIPHAVAEGDRAITEVQSSIERGKFGDFGRRHSTAIGLSVALVTDPVMYLSFGTATPARIAAMSTMGFARAEAARKASRIWDRSPGKFDGQRFADETELAEYIMIKEGKPLTLGDALDDMRLESSALKSEARRGRPTRGVIDEQGQLGYEQATGLRRATGTLAAYVNPAAKGGRGMRLGGVPVPGTPELGAYMGAKMREGARSLSKTTAYQALLKAVPNATLRHVAGDGIRAAALTKFARYNDKLGAVQASPIKVAQQLMRGPLVEARAAATKKTRRGDPQQVDAYKMEQSGVGLVGPGLYTSTNLKTVAHSFAQKGEAPLGAKASAGAGHVTNVKLPKTLTEKTIPADAPIPDTMWPDIIESATKALNEGLRAFTASKPIQPSTVERLLRGGVGVQGPPSNLIDLFNVQLHNLFLRNLPQELGEMALREFHLDLQQKLMAQGFRGYAHASKPAYPGAKGVKKDDVDYSFWDEDEFNQLVKGSHPEQQAERVVLGEASGLGEETRKGLHRKAMSDISDPKLKAFKKRINLTIGSLKSRALKVGMKEGEFDKHWKYFSDQFDDPIDAVALFSARIEGRTITRRFVDDMVKDPTFAYKLTKGKEPKPGYVTRAHAGEQYAVRVEIDEALDGITNPAIIDREIGRYLQLMNWPQNKWKIIATVPNMSFHSMNAIGAVFNNMLAGVYNPADYVSAVSMIFKGRMGRRRAEGRSIRGQVEPREPTGGQQRAMALEQTAESLGGLGRSSYIMAELERGVTKDLQEGLKPPGVARLVKPGPSLSKKRFAARRGRQATAAALAVTGNPLAAAVALPDIIAAGRYTAGTIEDVVRAAPFLKASKDPTVMRVLEAYGPVRIPGIEYKQLSRAQQEVMFEYGSQLSRTFQFDYTELTEFERRIAKTIFPFYTYYKKNIVRQATEVVKQPRHIAAWEKLTTEVNEESTWALPEEFQQLLPAYFAQLEAVAIPVPTEIRGMLGLPQDQQLYLNPKLPFISLNLFPPFWQLFQDTGQPTPQKWLQVAAPILGMWGPFSGPIPGAKPALEVLMNWQFGLARPIDFQRAQSNDWRQSFREAPGWAQFLPKALRDWSGIFYESESGQLMMNSTSAYILGQMATPFMDNLGNSIPPTASGEIGTQKARADMISWLTGVRIMPVDLMKLNRAAGYQMINMLSAEQRELKERGGDLATEDLVLLRRLRRQMRVIELAYDRRQKELGQ